MENTMGYIIQKPSDFKLCKECSHINWYENEVCWDCNSKEFDYDQDSVRDWYWEEMHFWLVEDKEFSCEEEVDTLEVQTK